MAENRRVKMTKAMLKDALIELLESRPISKITITDICKAADVNRSTFYSHYENEIMLFKEIQADVINKIPSLPETINEYTRGDFLLHSESFLKYIKKNKDMFKLLMFKSGDNQFNENLVRLVIDRYYVKSKIRETHIHEYKCYYNVCGIIGMLNMWIYEDFPVSEHTLAEFILNMSERFNEV